MQSQKIKLRTQRLNKEVGFVTFFLSILVYVLYLLTFSLVNANQDYSIWVFLLSWLGIFLFLYICFSWYLITNVVFTPYTIFMLFLFLFNYGQPFLWAFGIHDLAEIGKSSLYNFGAASTSDIMKAQTFTLISTLMFHTGAVFCYKEGNKRKLEKTKRSLNQYENPIILKSIYYTCFIVGIVVFPVTLIYSFLDLQISLTHGYHALYYSEYARTGINLTILETLFFPCLVGLLIGSKYNKKVTFYVYIVFALFIIFSALSGDRGSWVYKVIILVWLRHVCYKPINLKKTIQYGTLSVIALYIVDVLRSLRNTGISIEAVIHSLNLENNPFKSTIFEMGGSMQPLIVLQKYGWDVWPYANTYFTAITGMITNKITYLLDIPFSLIGSWFSDYLGITWGAGFSMFAEALLNFGPIFAPLFMIIMGYIITSFIYVNKRIDYKTSPFKVFFVAATLHSFIPVVRNSFHLLLKNWLYGVIALCIIILIFNALQRKFSKRYIAN
ncbi:O-antigen polysaccharide polymerase Wzy [Allobacillus sp. GCM10007491]|uniref:O-antigen polysaccharide polymerase Wzy n=1 Tax=Allobacillus saliphilus TaxID=2912308 RepID=A0A941HSC6_9BACI|nr:O-antigen polysaccharide polymerase Wzy [Allobacillus saliphilus]MBR7552550.1 O-antigen polysaccharide polymerase Wzy [Allobacillus saliphilus]